MSKRDPMTDPRPGDELHDYYHGPVKVLVVNGDTVETRFTNRRGNQYASFTLSRWRAYWAPPRHRLADTRNSIGYVTRTA